MEDGFWVAVICALCVLAALIFISETCELIDENNIGKAGFTFEFKEKVYKIVVDSAATDSLHNWRAK